MSYNMDKFGVVYSSVCVFLLGALSLVVSSGYSLGPALLLLASLPLVLYKPAWPTLDRDTKWLMAILLAFMLVWVAEVLLTGQRSREFDRPSRFLAATLALVWLIKYPPRLSFLWAGIALGAIAAFGVGLYEVIILDEGRATGSTNAIQFGNVALLLGSLCVAGLGWALSSDRRRFWTVLLILGAVAGFATSILSGSRGGWLSMPLVALVLYWCYRRWVKPVHVVSILVFVLASVVTLYAIPQTGVQKRTIAVVENFKTYSSGDKETSVGVRLELWKGAIMMISEKPAFGWGALGYQSQMEKFAESGVLIPNVADFDHAHNEYLDVFAKRGLAGLLALLALYLIPIFLFLRAAKRSNSPHIMSLSAAGAVLSVCYVGFSLTQSFMSHNSGVMLFVFYLVSFWAALQSELSYCIVRGKARRKEKPGSLFDGDVREINPSLGA